MQIALFHQVSADLLSISVGEKHIIRQNHCGARVSAPVQAAIDVLEEIKLFVTAGEGQVVTGGAFTAFLCTEGRIGQNDIIALQLRSERRQRIAQVDRAFDIMKHRVHQRKAMRVMHQLATGKRTLLLEFLLVNG